ncbi:exopolyphosphatase [Oceanobacillus halophilus]|uniref:exopolyphosphatase n=1 Tax=Oceanobacillus halophilus TaxID=930130 RepID=A0A495AB82_9BACI|nr:exopolyphosphatase [Oceanobacillus halophilus]RKQ35696.1 exopolyphosphatase [Oceanobacillus halophilus]
MQKNYYAVIDIGSNTMRLVIYSQVNSGRLHEVENVKSVARLRNSLDEKSFLTEAGISKMITTLRSFKEVVKTYSLTDLICVATATIRQAKNQKTIQQRVKEQIGWDMRVLSEKEEAFYGYLSVVNSTSLTEGITVDIGGGSTEVTYFKDRILLESHSFPFGALTLQKFFSESKSNEQAVTRLRHFLLEQFHSLGWLKGKQVPLIGIGGSARNLAQIDQSIRKYPLAGLHQYKMNDSDIAKVLNLLVPMKKEELEKVEGLSSDRTDTIVPAIAVFHSLYDMIDAKGFILSRKGLRDGVFYERLTRDLKYNLYPNVLQDSIQELVHEYTLNIEQIQHIQLLTRKFFVGLKEKGIGSLTQDDWAMLERACFVYNLGEYIDSESSAQHTFYLLANRTIDGLMHIDRLKLALIASYKNKTVFKQFISPFKNWFLKEERKKLGLLGAMIKFTYCLDATKRQVVQDVDITFNGETIQMKIYGNKDYKPEEYQTKKQKRHLEKALHQTIELEFLDVPN